MSGKYNVNESEQSSPDDRSVESPADNFRQDSKTVKFLVRFGLIIVVVGLLMVFNAGDKYPMIMVMGILATAVGVFTAVIAKFYTWWKNG